MIFPKWRHPCVIAILATDLLQIRVHTGDWWHEPCMSFLSSSTLLGHICKNRQDIRILTLPCFSSIFHLRLWSLVLSRDPKCDKTQQFPQWLSSNVDDQSRQFSTGASKTNRALSLSLMGSLQGWTWAPYAWLLLSVSHEELRAHLTSGIKTFEMPHPWTVLSLTVCAKLFPQP